MPFDKCLPDIVSTLQAVGREKWQGRSIPSPSNVDPATISQRGLMENAETSLPKTDAARVPRHVFRDKVSCVFPVRSLGPRRFLPAVAVDRIGAPRAFSRETSGASCCAYPFQAPGGRSVMLLILKAAAFMFPISALQDAVVSD